METLPASSDMSFIGLSMQQSMDAVTGRFSTSMPAFQDLPREHPPRPEGITAYGGGYGNWKYQQNEMAEKVRRLMSDLPKLMVELDCDFVAVSGTSGTFIAGALVAACGLPVLMIRKPGENSHGDLIEGNSEHKYRRGIILDDFVSSGATVRRMIETLGSVYPETHVSLVAVVEHASTNLPGSLGPNACGKTTVCGLPVYSY